MITVNYKPNWDVNNQNNDSIIIGKYVQNGKNYLFFLIDLKDVDEDETIVNEKCEEFYEYMNKVENTIDRYFLKIVFWDQRQSIETEDTPADYIPEFHMITHFPYQQTLETYLTKQSHTLVELEYLLINIIHLYESIQHMHIPLVLSMKDMSIVLVSLPDTPFPHICISPYK